MAYHLFVAGVPATGKTWLGCWLAERGYIHIDAEKALQHGGCTPSANKRTRPSWRGEDSTWHASTVRWTTLSEIGRPFPWCSVSELSTASGKTARSAHLRKSGPISRRPANSRPLR